MTNMDYVGRAIKAERRVAELEREIELLKKENMLLRERQDFWRWKAWAERYGKRRLDMEHESVFEP